MCLVEHQKSHASSESQEIRTETWHETQDTNSKGNECFGDYCFHIELELVAWSLVPGTRERAKRRRQKARSL